MSLNLILVGTTGFEPATSSVSRKRSNQLSYAPALLPYTATGFSLSGSLRLGKIDSRVQLPCCTIVDELRFDSGCNLSFPQ